MSRRRGSTRRKSYSMLPAVEHPAIAEQLLTEGMWFRHIQALILSRIVWENLPPTCNEKFLEKALLFNGVAVFCKMKDSLISTAVEIHGARDMYDEPIQYTSVAMGTSPHRFEIPMNEGVIVYNTLDGFQDWYHDIARFAHELALVTKVKMTNIKQQASLVGFFGPEERSADMGKLIAAFDRGEPWMYFNDSLASTGGGIEHVNLNVPLIADELEAQITAILNRVYAHWGIEYIEQSDKKAHLLTAEAGSTEDSVGRMRINFLKPRQDAVKKINEKWGTNIVVRWNTDAKDEMSDKTDEKETDDE
jgi:hypothetical protein